MDNNITHVLLNNKINSHADRDMSTVLNELVDSCFDALSAEDTVSILIHNSYAHLDDEKEEPVKIGVHYSIFVPFPLKKKEDTIDINNIDQIIVKVYEVNYLKEFSKVEIIVKGNDGTEYFSKGINIDLATLLNIQSIAHKVEHKGFVGYDEYIIEDPNIINPDLLINSIKDGSDHLLNLDIGMVNDKLMFNFIKLSVTERYEEGN
jgi:hypothetical protein